MNTLDKIRSKVPGLSDYFNQKAFVWRNRGDSYALEVVDAVRIKYNDKPNRHELSTGEVIPAVPKSYTGNMYGGGSYFLAVEGDDDQLVVWKPKFNVQDLVEENMGDGEGSDVVSSLPIDLDSDMSGDKVYQRLEDKNFDAVNYAVLDNRDERFTFLSEEVKTSDDKYSLSSLLYENPEMVMALTTAVAVAIIIYGVTGDIPGALQNFGEQMSTFNNNVDVLTQQLNQTQTPPPGR